MKSPRMKWSNSATVLAILLLILGALLLRGVEYRRYSDAAVEEALSALCEEYALLQHRHASHEEWREFAQRAAEITEPIVADLENNPYVGQQGRSYLHDIARFQLPQAIASEGKVPATALAKSIDGAKQVRQTQLEEELKRRRQEEAASGGGLNSLLNVAILVLDISVALCLGYLVLPALKSLFFGGAGNPEKALQHLNERLERNPASVRDRGLRAHLFTKLGRYGEALADIDWILAHQPQDTSVDSWRRLRETVMQKQTPAV